MVNFSHHSNALSNFYSDKLSKIQRLQDTAKNKLISLKCISSINKLPIIQVDAEDDTSPKSDLKGDFYDVKNSARKNNFESPIEDGDEFSN